MKLSALEFLLGALLLLVSAAGSAHGALKKFHWKAEYLYWSPDCVETVLIGINGQYPGPTIRATAGDVVQVELENGIGTEGLVIHWHGIRQIGTPHSDGTAYVSQCPINPGETFTYKFLVDRPGTYFYHGHFGMQRSAGLYGSLIVDAAPGDPVPFTYHGEHNIIVNDWWHRSIYNQEAGLGNKPFRFVGEPQSLLLEGRGRYDCSLIPSQPSSFSLSGDVMSCNSSHPQCQMHVLPVERGKTYRLRLASVASLSSINFMLEGHSLTVVESDGHYIQPVKVDNIDLYSGQTYSVLFTADQDPTRNYWIVISVRGRKPSTSPGLGVLRYQENSSGHLLRNPTTTPPQSPVWNDFAYSEAQQRVMVARTGFKVAVPERARVKLMLLATQNRIDGKIKWAINNVSYVPRPTPLLAALKYNLTEAYNLEASPPTSFPRNYQIQLPPGNPVAKYGSGVYIFRLNDVVDVVLQNANTLTVNNSEIHPWHLHGHDFWVLGYGSGMFRPHRHTKLLNFKNPPMKNTVAMFPYGWTYIRFRADNPGAWAFHCHVESHFHMGMGVMFAEGIQQIPAIPNQALGCGATKSLIKP